MHCRKNKHLFELLSKNAGLFDNGFLKNKSLKFCNYFKHLRYVFIRYPAKWASNSRKVASLVTKSLTISPFSSTTIRSQTSVTCIKS